jgi:hypothetical protein
MPPIPTRTIEARSPTPGELELIAAVFGEALDPSRLTFRRGKWWFLQPAWIVMAPDGHVWFHPNNPSWCADFSTAHLGLRALVVHELVHVWQHQRGVNLVRARKPFSPYRYLPLTPGKPFAAYGVEQQAEIVRHAYVLREGGRVPDAPPLRAYAEIIPFGRWERPLLA